MAISFSPIRPALIEQNDRHQVLYFEPEGQGILSAYGALETQRTERMKLRGKDRLRLAKRQWKIDAPQGIQRNKHLQKMEEEKKQAELKRSEQRQKFTLSESSARAGIQEIEASEFWKIEQVKLQSQKNRLEQHEQEKRQQIESNARQEMKGIESDKCQMIHELELQKIKLQMRVRQITSEESSPRIILEIEEQEGRKQLRLQLQQNELIATESRARQQIEREEVLESQQLKAEMSLDVRLMAQGVLEETSRRTIQNEETEERRKIENLKEDQELTCEWGVIESPNGVTAPAAQVAYSESSNVELPTNSGGIWATAASIATLGYWK